MSNVLQEANRRKGVKLNESLKRAEPTGRLLHMTGKNGMFTSARVTRRPTVLRVTVLHGTSCPLEVLLLSAMKQFYEKHNKSNGLWATFSVTGSTTICGVCATSTVLYRDRDLDKIKDAFNEVFTVELFSLQIVEIEDLRKLMSMVRLQDQNLVRLNDARAPVYSSEVALMARNLRDEIELANSDFLLAMRNILDENENSYLNGKTRIDKKENRCLEEAETKVKDSLLNNESVFSQSSSTDSLEQPLSPIDNLSQSSASSENSCDCEESAVDGEQLAPRKRNNVSKLDEAPAKKRQAERSVETYRDEDGFLSMDLVLSSC
ncbi:unnamed protein product [Angiostrongylus costaricensis]|uniref:BRF1 domain-containing protein n=1 Tax=Angiostrongylus costaricensis TaxID=334426 RepID=A0A0R3Q214_ANGCS|nr:unnamed protein product [Angiostrongylus costaricensis]